jgi:hypothetical protein
MAADLSPALFELHRSTTSPQWPSSLYRDDPVRFCCEVLGVDLWPKQVEIAESVRDNPLTSVKSGHRIGKSTIGAAIALWFYASFEDARVIMTAPTARQVEGILWRELRKLFERAKVRLDGEISPKAATGLVSANFREVRGYTAKDVEAITGTAGANLLFLLDEASGIADAIYEGLEGNRAGWAEEAGVMVRMLLLGNPTKTRGEFYDSHEHPRKKQVYHRITVSSRETPNAVQGRIVFPGLATREWIAQMEAKYGADSAFVKVRVDGEFPVGEDGKAFSIDAITRSQERWDDTIAEGRLFVGIDPAGDSGTGDDACFSVRRGAKQLRLRAELGLDETGHGRVLLELIDEHESYQGERAIVVMDSEGPVGTRVYRNLRALSHRTGRFELYGVRASQQARQRATFDRVRDELAGALGKWLRDEKGALLEDELLEDELHVLEWESVKGKSKITPKKKIRQELGRSPDRYDATALSVWEPSAATESAAADERVEDELDDIEPAASVNPYSGAFDPYGGR